jgi:CHAD domain-containing protein
MAKASNHKVPVAAAGAVAAGGAAVAGKLVHDRRARRAEVRRARAYRLREAENVPDGVRRIARGQIDLAAERLDAGAGSDAQDAIHEARKAFKRLRALVRLSRDALGDEIYRRENATFRDAGRRLSGARDAAVMVQTLEDVMRRFDDELPDGALAGLREALIADAEAAREQTAQDSGAVDDVLATLEAQRGHVATWPLPEHADLAMLAPGFQRMYRRGRRALRAARKDTDTEHLHELRKRAKDLWHGAQVLRPADPKRMKKLARRAHDLSDVVGEDHDLAVLLDGARRRADTLAPGELELLDGLVGRRRARLQRKALALGRRVYARKPRTVARLAARSRG